MSDGSIFRFNTAASSITGVTASAFHHAALDADASARLAAMDRAFTEDEQAEVEQTEVEVKVQQVEVEQVEVAQLKAEPIATDSLSGEPSNLGSSKPESLNDASSPAAHEQNSSASSAATPCANEIDSTDPLAILAEALPQPVTQAVTQTVTEPVSEPVAVMPLHDSTNVAAEIEPAQIVAVAPPAASDELAAEVSGIFAAAEAAGEVIHHHRVVSELAVAETSIIETAVAETDHDAEAEAGAPAALEVASILDASGELQAGADDYTPPTPFQIHVPDALTVREIPLFDAVTENLADKNNLSETFDLDSLCSPTESEQLIEHAIAQEDAVAEMSAVAAEFVAEQIAAESAEHVTALAASDTHVPGASVEQPIEPPIAQVVPSSLADAAAALQAGPASDRRRKRRALISAPVRVRSIDITTSGPDEIATTVDVSRYGILFHTVLDTYQRGMDVAVVFPYHKSATGVQSEQFGRVVRLHDMPDGRHAVAIALGVGIGEHLVDASGRKLGNEPVQISNSTAPQVKKPLVLMADSDNMLRDGMKMYLQNEGYEVIAVNNANDAREVLNMFMPAMIVAEIEGEGDLLPGLDLCAHVKSSPSLRRIPVVLTSRSAYPSDYANAHSLGAVVCMAKPYKQERLGHVVRLLAPLPEHLQSTAAQRVPDPTRGFRSDCNVAQRQNGNSTARNGAKKSNGNGAAAPKPRFKFPSFR
jgi:CheY-like chemotaxis protein